MNECKICKNSVNNKVISAREMMFGTRETFEYIECAVCKCVQIREFPADMSKHYPREGYYTGSDLDERKYEGLSGMLHLFPKEANLRQKSPFHWISNEIKQQPHFSSLKGLSVSEKTRILDVGCGNGKHFVYPMTALGFRNVAGCDPFNESKIEYSNGGVIYNETLAELCHSLGSESLDIISFHHSFEHIDNPKETLEAAHKLLGENGVCIIRIPTVSSQAWKTYGTDWFQFDAPRHFFLHSKESMNRLSETTGFELSHVQYDSGYGQFWRSELYQQDIPMCDHKKDKSLRGLLQRRTWKKQAKQLNQQQLGDQAAFYLTKVTRKD